MTPDTLDAAGSFNRLSDVYRDAVSPFIEPDQPFALMDFPNHSNVGDSAIWVGEMAFFDAYVRRPASFVNTYAEDPAEVAEYVPEGPVFIHGGGNFGDIWPQHQTFRLRAMEVLKGRPLVQLPQSVHFDNEKGRDETARAIAAHGQVTLLVRDQPSLEFAQAHFDCAVQMAPDAAVNIHHLPANDPVTDVISFMRGDRESVWGDAITYLESLGEITDWPAPDVWTLPDRIRQKLYAPFARPAMAHREAMYRRQAQMRVQAGVAHMAPARQIVSDRLHVHLIAALMRRPHVVLDNVYGKIGRHIEAWGDFGLARRVADVDTLRAVMSERAGG
ncbi:polysaccharide pyruvyl transferase family protein [uncultured Roseobacter sp.]|uniref:polysaccharide pyruvyl transferase family protein n=1 Tax=uncultured Roseobacter sp. TaxID=114847 RepID=UPI002612FBF0|nr:polysaccharide pyruvyl transferase family protein [uncultured Roseobacter sp.]